MIFAIQMQFCLGVCASYCWPSLNQDIQPLVTAIMADIDSLLTIQLWTSLGEFLLFFCFDKGSSNRDRPVKPIRAVISEQI
ncbi:hypothetical protein C488_21262 [Natrinema pellirubrum DSM 15624]|uniref:Uncharacterized protein n=1 Tax=Natrinema pellirubrum (strain DSM 15624 / CIP 106293 / JCM 10476 / NCIMB 786 / 157) TaxID=797303 RepID=L9Y5L6_NATP1|nr:hypothetical protein C488_21262 [Natrinema pellirubrum DSM 15624]